MSIQELDVLLCLLNGPGTTQRDLSRNSGYSVGIVNQTLRKLKEKGMIDAAGCPTAAAESFAKSHSPLRAIILAAGFGLRMIPADKKCPKGLLEISGEPIIEHTIRQLQEVGIREIILVAGYMKEMYEYLTDRFGVKMICCKDYLNRSNLYSLAAAKSCLSDAYIVPSDVYFYINPFRSTELYSWYMLSKESSLSTDMRVTRTREIRYIQPGTEGNTIVGLAYLSHEEAEKATNKLEELTAEGKNTDAFWEMIISDQKQMMIPARLVSPEYFVEINTYEQLREVDYYNKALKDDIIACIQEALHVSSNEIKDVTILKKGLTNRSFLFSVHGLRYIIRVPGEDTEEFMVDREEEGRIYQLLEGKGICSDNIYYNPEKGYKIALFIENARDCNDEDSVDIAACMQKLRRFHSLKLPTGNQTSLFDLVDYYEKLWPSPVSMYRDYREVKQRILDMRPFIEKYGHEHILCHGNCVPDNFLFYTDRNGEKQLDLIDWEYSGRNDPLTDIASFICYHAHEKYHEYADRVIDAYFPEGCKPTDRLLVYCYLALCALYNSNWCEFKNQSGVEFGDFPLTEYRYAKWFSRVFWEELPKYNIQVI